MRKEQRLNIPISLLLKLNLKFSKRKENSYNALKHFIHTFKESRVIINI